MLVVDHLIFLLFVGFLFFGESHATNTFASQSKELAFLLYPSHDIAVCDVAHTLSSVHDSMQQDWCHPVAGFDLQLTAIVLPAAPIPAHTFFPKPYRFAFSGLSPPAFS
jgi:hypothetical protein